MRPSIKQIRFLIIWCVFHLFALMTNLIPIKGEIKPEPFHWPSYIFTDGDYRSINGTFWPFVELIRETRYEIRGEDRLFLGYGEETKFSGLFYNYTLSAFIVYALLGLAIVFIPKLWNSQNRVNKPHTQ